MNKRTWGPGPWQAEPDLVLWWDAETDFELMIIRSEMSGALCGLLAVRSGHPWYLKEYDFIRAEVHEGLTFSNFRAEGPGWWIGFDCGHEQDVRPASEARLREAGYEPCRFDYQQYRDIKFVKEQLDGLARQALSARAEEPASGDGDLHLPA
jgi:hypothetical protein